MQCESKRREGGRCGARAEVGKKYCVLHGEPGRAAILGGKGGRRRTVYRPSDLKEFSAPKCAADLRDLMAESIVEIRSGKMDPKVANALGYLGASYLRALEAADLETRLANLERVMDAGTPGMEIGNIAGAP